MGDKNDREIPSRSGKEALERMDAQAGGLQLSAIRDEEIPQLMPLFNEPGAAGFYIPAMIRPYSQEQLKAMMADWNDHAESYVFAVRKEGDLVGIVNIDGFSWANSHAEIGIALISPQYRGHGYASSALHLLLDYLFLDVGLHRVYCRIMEGNTSSMRLFINA